MAAKTHLQRELREQASRQAGRQLGVSGQIRGMVVSICCAGLVQGATKAED